MSHAYHEGLPGYDEGSIWHDGCDECEDRAKAGVDGLHSLATNSFRQAWADMLALEWSGGEGLARNVSACDRRLFRTLYALAVVLERHAALDPRDLLATIDATTARLHERLLGL